MIDGRPALQVLADPQPAVRTLEDLDHLDQHTFVRLPIDFRNGTIAVSLRSRPADDAPAFARGFAGLAYRIDSRSDAFEAVYLRPTNGKYVAPDELRASRAVQWTQEPAWSFSRLRREHPNGRFEAAADIRPDQWARLEVTVNERRVLATVDGVTVLDLERTPAEPLTGNLGLFAGIGTNAHFTDLTVHPS
jgi:hypothetical protein